MTQDSRPGGAMDELDDVTKARLRRRLDGLRAIPAEERLEALQTQHKALYEAWMRANERDSRCEHHTLSSPWLPCPHPDCFPMADGERDVMFWRPQKPASLYYAESVPVDAGTQVETSAFRRQRLRIAGTEYWAWEPRGSL